VTNARKKHHLAVNAYANNVLPENSEALKNAVIVSREKLKSAIDRSQAKENLKLAALKKIKDKRRAEQEEKQRLYLQREEENGQCSYCNYVLVKEGESFSTSDGYCNGIQAMREDPFASEIRGDYSPYLLCPGAAYESAMDI
jgi:hypothetical protein